MIGSKLSIKNSRFHLATAAGDAQITATSLNVVIVGANPRLSKVCLLYTSPSPRDKRQSRMPSSA